MYTKSYKIKYDSFHDTYTLYQQFEMNERATKTWVFYTLNRAKEQMKKCVRKDKESPDSFILYFDKYGNEVKE